MSQKGKTMRSYSDTVRKREAEIQELKERIAKLEAVAEAAEGWRVTWYEYGGCEVGCGCTICELVRSLAALHGGE